MNQKTVVIECGSCGSLHRLEYRGDCRNDAERFADAGDVAERLHVSEADVTVVPSDFED